MNEAASKHSAPDPSEVTIPELSAEQWRGLAKLAESTTEALGEAFSGDDAPTAEEIRQYVQLLRRLMEIMAAVRAFVGTDLAGELTGASIKAMAFSRENDLPAAVGDALLTVSHLHRNGTFARVREISDQVAGLTSGVETDALVAAIVERVSASPLSRTGAMTRTVEDVVEGVEDEQPDLGGLRGLLHMLQDEEVQRGLVTLASVPGKLQAQTRES